MTTRLRFYRRLRLCRGVTLNLGKRGINSVSVGQRGAHLTFGRHGRQRATIGLTGTGLYLTEELHPHQHHIRSTTTAPATPTGSSPTRIFWIVCAVLVLAALLSACAGRPPQQIATVQPQDRTSTCAEITAEAHGNSAQIQELAGEQGAKVAQNVAAGIVGL